MVIKRNFEKKIKNIIETPGIMKNYWNGYHKLKTMDEHVSELEEIY